MPARELSGKAFRGSFSKKLSEGKLNENPGRIQGERQTIQPSAKQGFQPLAKMRRSRSTFTVNFILTYAKWVWMGRTWIFPTEHITETPAEVPEELLAEFLLEYKWTFEVKVNDCSADLEERCSEGSCSHSSSTKSTPLTRTI